MNLSELVHEIWSDERMREEKINKSHIKLVVEVMIDVMRKKVLEGVKVNLRGFCSVKIRKRKGRIVKHPVTREDVEYDDHYVLNAEPSVWLKEELKKKDT